MSNLDNIDENLIEIIEDKLNSGFIKANGIEILEAKKGYVKGRIVINELHLNSWNAVHGGCIFSLADTIAGIAAISCMGNVVTLSGNINYIRPAINTAEIIGEAEVIHSGSSTAVVDVLLKSHEGKILSKSTLTFHKV